jgi:predicted secreted protein
MQPIHGSNVLVSIEIDGEFVPVLCAIDMTFSCEQEVVLATTIDSGKWRKKKLRGLSDWNVAVSGLSKIDNADGQVSFFYLLQENIRGSEQIIQMMFEDDDGNVQVLEGSVLIPSLSINANVNSFADVNVTFEGTGGVTIEQPVSGVESGVCDDWDSDTFDLAEDETSISGAFAGKEIIEVDREGTQYDHTTGVPGNREYSYNGVNINFAVPGLPDGEKVFVIWKL